MSIEKRLRVVLVITLFSGMASILTILHISKSIQFHHINSKYNSAITELSDLLAYPESHPPSIYQVIDILDKIRDQSSSCLAKSNSIDKAVLNLISTKNIINICENILSEINGVTLISEKELEINPENHVLNDALRDRLSLVPYTLSEYLGPFTSLVDKTISFSIEIAMWFIIPFFLLVFLLNYTIIKSVTRNAIEYRRTAKALAESEVKNRELAYYDQLTSLPNRNLLKDRLEQTIETSIRNHHSFALIFIDLDRFKHINDTLGHTVGDELIKLASKRIKTTIRNSDTLARFGGDEFVIILPQLRLNEDVSKIADKIIKNLSKPYNLEGMDTYITASLGIAIYPDNGNDISTLLKRADIAMYQSKENGKNQFYFYDDEINRTSDKRLLLERDIRNGFDKDEFCLFYQPVIELETGNIAGLEALLRWNHNSTELISPNDFIPIAEDTGLIVDIGYKIIEMACEQCHTWRNNSSPNIHVAINISARQLKDEKLVTHIEECLSRFSLPPSAIDIEITESAFYSNDKKCINVLNQLNELDLRLLLDDFGTGYSSLSTLHTMPFNIIKIDRSFISFQQGKNLKITSSILDMAQNFEMDVVAEGIEDSDTAAFLKQRGCKYGQGYLFKKPLPPHELDLSENFTPLISQTERLELIK